MHKVRTENMNGLDFLTYTLSILALLSILSAWTSISSTHFHGMVPNSVSIFQFQCQSDPRVAFI